MKASHYAGSLCISLFLAATSCSRQDNNASQNSGPSNDTANLIEVNQAMVESQGVAIATPPTPTNLGTNRFVAARSAVLPKENETNSGPEEITEADVASIAGIQVKKEDWSNLGFGTVPALIQTYYWALREGIVDRFFECHSHRESKIWFHIYPSTDQRRAALTLEFTSSVSNVLAYKLSAAARLEQDKQFVVAVSHEALGGHRWYELLAVVKEAGEWRVDGERGYLPYLGHRGGLVPIDLTLEYRHRNK